MKTPSNKGHQMFQKKSKFNKLTESNVDHFNKYPRTYTATAVVGLAASVLIIVKFLKRNRTPKPELPLPAI